jgi:hypothetical protein
MDGVAEVSRKDAKTLRFEKEIAGLVVNPTNLRCFGVFLLFAPSRLRVKNSFMRFEPEVSREGAKTLRFSDLLPAFAPLRLCVKNSLMQVMCVIPP